MGLIEYAKGKWIDIKTKKEVRDSDVSKKYMAHFQVLSYFCDVVVKC